VRVHERARAKPFLFRKFLFDAPTGRFAKYSLGLWASLRSMQRALVRVVARRLNGANMRASHQIMHSTHSNMFRSIIPLHARMLSSEQPEAQARPISLLWDIAVISTLEEHFRTNYTKGLALFRFLFRFPLSAALSVQPCCAQAYSHAGQGIYR
jgi:hypothetical protein